MKWWPPICPLDLGDFRITVQCRPPVACGTLAPEASALSWIGPNHFRLLFELEKIVLLQQCILAFFAVYTRNIVCEPVVLKVGYRVLLL